MPLFSVIVPMYNVEKYARQCIESILAQTYEDFELILVDDGAKDSTPQIIDDYAKKDARIIAIHKENGGLVSARKAGAKVATGDYVVPVDGDDWIHAEYLRKFADVIGSTPDIDLVCVGFFAASDDGNQEEHISRLPEGLLDKALLEKLVYPKFSIFPQSQWAKAYKKELYKEFQSRIDNCITIAEDESLILPMIYKLNSAFVLHECLYYYRHNPASMTKNKKKEWPTEGLIARLGLFEESFDFDKYELETQFTAYVAHAVINQSLSYFKANPYFVARKKTRALLDNEFVNKYISKIAKIKNRKEKLAKFALKNKLFILVKFYSLFW